MHLNDNLMRAYADQALSQEQRQRAREHLSRCPACQKRLAEMTSRSRFVQSALDRLQASAAEQPRPTAEVYQRFAARGRRPTSTKEYPSTMSTKRTVLTVLTALAVIALVFSVTPARAWASDLLGLFRVQKVQVITFDPAALENADGQLEANRKMIEQVFSENLQIEERGETVELQSAAEAAGELGFTPRVPTALENPKIFLQPGVDAQFTIDQPKLQELMDVVGADAQIPESADGKVVTANIPNALVFTNGCEVSKSGSGQMSDCDMVFQMFAPEVNAPEEIDVQRLGASMFQFLGLPAGEAAALSQRIDWATTLVLPIPQDADIKYQEVQVDGATATLLETDEGAMLLWVKDGILYSVRSRGAAADALNLAASLQ